MFSEMVTRTQNGLKQSAVWSVVVWSLVFNLILLAVFAIMGIHMAPSLTSFPTPTATAKLGGAALLMLLVMVLAGPYWIAATYGTLAEAANGQPITWGSFWQNGRKMYGRAWGLIGFSLLWVIGLMIIAMLFGAMLRALGILVIILWIIISLPILIRMTGGLFSRQLTWGQSFSQSFQPAGWGTLWLAMAAYSFASIIILLLVSLILGHIPVIGSVLVLFVDVILGVVGGIWAFAAYEVTTPKIQ
jgi:hypothetical protein